MPGITGIIRKSRYPEMDHDLGLMVDAMCHQPRSSTGAYSDDELGIVVGWVCHPGSFADCMPVVNRNRDTVLVFSGETYSTASPPCRKALNASSLLDLYAES